VGVLALVVISLWALPRLDAGAATAAVVSGPIVVQRDQAPDGHYTADTVTFPRLTAVGHVEYGGSTYDGAFAFDGVQYEYLEFVYCGTLSLSVCYPVIGYPLVGHAPIAPATAPIDGTVAVVAIGTGSETAAGSCGGGGSYATAAKPSGILLVLECSLQLDAAAPAHAATVTIDLVEVRGQYVAGALTTA
jgi:hypothetical protein